MQEQPYDILLTLEAVDDVAEIEAYIEMSFGGDSLHVFQKKWAAQQDFIASQPHGSASTKHEYQVLTIYMRVFKPSLIFYILEESMNTAVILRVLREESNWESIIINTDDYDFPSK